jgi:hypothetical protein
VLLLHRVEERQQRCERFGKLQETQSVAGGSRIHDESRPSLILDVEDGEQRHRFVYPGKRRVDEASALVIAEVGAAIEERDQRVAPLHEKARVRDRGIELHREEAAYLGNRRGRAAKRNTDGIPQRPRRIRGEKKCALAALPTLCRASRQRGRTGGLPYTAFPAYENSRREDIEERIQPAHSSP